MWTWVPRWGVCNSNYLGDGPTRSIGLPGTLKALRASGPDAAERSLSAFTGRPVEVAPFPYVVPLPALAVCR